MRATNDIEFLWEISKRIAKKGVDILPLSGAVSGKNCILRLVADDNLRAKEDGVTPAGSLCANRVAPERAPM